MANSQKKWVTQVVYHYMAWNIKYLVSFKRLVICLELAEGNVQSLFLCGSDLILLSLVHFIEYGVLETVLCPFSVIMWKNVMLECEKSRKNEDQKQSSTPTNHHRHYIPFIFLLKTQWFITWVEVTLKRKNAAGILKQFTCIILP